MVNFFDLQAWLSPVTHDAWIDFRIIALMYDTTVEHVLRHVITDHVRWELDPFGDMFVLGEEWVARFGEPIYCRRN
jgi:hypothetical protein